MLRLLEWLIFGHIHEWKFEDRMHLRTSGRSTGDRVMLSCKTCGDWKKRDLI